MNPQYTESQRISLASDSGASSMVSTASMPLNTEYVGGIDGERSAAAAGSSELLPARYATAATADAPGGDPQYAPSPYARLNLKALPKAKLRADVPGTEPARVTIDDGNRQQRVRVLLRATPTTRGAGACGSAGANY